MASSAADDIIKELEQLTVDRLPFDAKFQQVADLAAPDAGDFTGTSQAFLHQVSPGHHPRAAERSKLIYDNTAAWCIDRLAPGIEALIAPQAEKWHGFKQRGVSRARVSDETRVYLDDLRDALFDIRYDMDGGWSKTLQTCIRRTIGFGTSLMFIEEGWDDAAMIRYSYMPLAESYIATDSHDFVNTFVRHYALTAAQAAEKFGLDNLSPKLQRAVSDPKDQHRRFRFVHRIGARGDFGALSGGIRSSKHTSVHIEFDARHVVKESGFFSFPIIDFRWGGEPGGVYSEGPLMKVLAEVQSLNLLAKNELTASQQVVKPPLLVADAGIMNRPDTHPGAVNYGGLTPNGTELIKPMNLGIRLDFAQALIEAKQKAVKESMYINLFQILVDNPRMTATEALIKANEKGELLGPAGSALQGSLARANTREMQILEIKGMFADDSDYAKPEDLQGRKIVPDFSSQLDRLRRTGEAEGTMRLLEIMSPLMQMDETIAQEFEGGEMARGMAEILGVPARYVKSREKRDAEVEAQQQQQAMTSQAQMAQQMAAAGKQGTEALAGLQQMGL